MLRLSTFWSACNSANGVLKWDENLAGVIFEDENGERVDVKVAYEDDEPDEGFEKAIPDNPVTHRYYFCDDEEIIVRLEDLPEDVKYITFYHHI